MENDAGFRHSTGFALVEIPSMPVILGLPLFGFLLGCMNAFKPFLVCRSKQVARRLNVCCESISVRFGFNKLRCERLDNRVRFFNRNFVVLMISSRLKNPRDSPRLSSHHNSPAFPPESSET